MLNKFLLIFYIFYTSAVHFCKTNNAQGNFRWLTSPLLNMPPAVLGWAAISEREMLKDELLAWHRWLTDPQAATCNSLNATLAWLVCNPNV